MLHLQRACRTGTTTWGRLPAALSGASFHPAGFIHGCASMLDRVGNQTAPATHTGNLAAWGSRGGGALQFYGSGVPGNHHLHGPAVRGIHYTGLHAREGDSPAVPPALPAPAEAPAPPPPPGTPEGALAALTAKGEAQGVRPASQAFASSFLGGVMLSTGGLLMLQVAGGSAEALAGAPGALAMLKGMLFPVGLSMIVLSGSELLTGNMMTQALPKWGAGRGRAIAEVLGVSLAGNLSGSLALASAASFAGLLSGPAAAHAAAGAAAKCALPASVAFVKGIGANWLVGVAIFQATVATTAAGKVAALWLPIATFVALGMEHSVANMFLLPMGALCGADIGVADILGNLAPVGLGNAVGAAVLVAGVRWSILGPRAARASL